MTKKSIAAFLRRHKGNPDLNCDAGGGEAGQNKTRQAQCETTASEEHANDQFAPDLYCKGANAGPPSFGLHLTGMPTAL
jgi:hypothetical protein